MHLRLSRFSSCFSIWAKVSRNHFEGKPAAIIRPITYHLLGMAWLKVWTLSLGVGLRLIGVDQDHSRRTDAGKHPSGLNDAGSSCAAGIVRSASRPLVSPAGSPAASATSRGKIAANIGGFPHLGHDIRRDVQGTQDFLRPPAVNYIQQHRTCSIRHLSEDLSGEPVADIVFGQQDLIYLLVDLRFVLLQPDDLGGL